MLRLKETRPVSTQKEDDYRFSQAFKALPNLTSIALGVKPEFAGTASGLMGVAQLGVGVVLSSILGVVISDSVVPLLYLEG